MSAPDSAASDSVTVGAGSSLDSNSTSLFVSGIPTTLVGVRKLLKQALSEYALRSCRVSVSCFNRSRTFAHLTVRSHVDGVRLIAEQDGRLRLPGTPDSHPSIRIAWSCGKSDMLFPFLPVEKRRQMRLDPTALFSVTAQESAQQITQLILCLLDVAQRDPETRLVNTLEVRASKTNANLDAAAVVKAALEKQKREGDNGDNEEERHEESMERPDNDDVEDGPSIDTTSSSTIPFAAYSPDAGIDGLIRRLADGAWSTWTDLDDPPVTPAQPIIVSPYAITDACACSGGNAIDFGRHFSHTNAIEIDPQRCDDLRHNIRLLGLEQRVRVIEGDANIELPKFHQSVIYADVPWGGPQYKDSISKGADLFLGTTSLKDWCWNLYMTHSCRLVVLRLPFDYDHSSLARHMVRIPPEFETCASSEEEGLKLKPFDIPRPHPFKIQLEKVVILVFALPSKEEMEQAREKIFGKVDTISTQAAASSSPSTSSSSSSPSSLPPLHFTLRNLDSLIYTLNGYNHFHHYDMDPAFFDWEKLRWIATRRWRGCTLQPATKLISDEKQAMLESEGREKRPGVASERNKKNMKRMREKQEAKKEEKMKRKQQKMEIQTTASNVNGDGTASLNTTIAAASSASASASAPPADTVSVGRVTIRGGCHCRSIRFEATIERRQTILDCNCSICSLSGFLHLIVPHTDFHLIDGTNFDALTSYRFNTGQANHLFCKKCGTKSFYQPRSHPGSWSVHLRSLDDESQLELTFEKFDGRDWEKAKAELK